MNKEFVPPTESSELKELGFNEPCLKFYVAGMLALVPDTENGDTNSKLNEYNTLYVSAPTFSQAFKFFREKHGLDCSFEDDMVEDEDGNELQMWDFFIYKTKQKSDDKVMDFCSNNFETFIESYSREEVELECLRQLIKIVK